MSRPSDFCKAHLTTNVAPYQMISNPVDQPERGNSNGGVFHRGQKIWTQETPARLSKPHTALGFVEGVGHVLVDARLLRPVEAVATN